MNDIAHNSKCQLQKSVKTVDSSLKLAPVEYLMTNHSLCLVGGSDGLVHKLWVHANNARLQIRDCFFFIIFLSRSLISVHVGTCGLPMPTLLL